MSARRVVVTGIGVLSPLGLGVDGYWAGRLEGRSAVARLSRFDVGEFPVQVGGEIRDFEARKLVPQRKALKVMARDIQLACAAAHLCAQHAQWDCSQEDPARMGVVLGAGLINSDIDELGAAVVASRGEDGRYSDARFGQEGMGALFPLWLLKHLPNMPASHISIHLDAQGPNNSITTACTGATQAIGESMRILQRGAADVMMAGGADCRIHPLILLKMHGFGGLAVGPDAVCRPYDRERSGTVLGEAAAVLLLEELEHARRRGATILAEIVGYGCSSGPFYHVEPEAGATYSTVATANALREAELDGSRLGGVVGHGLGMRQGDAAEGRALLEVLGAEGPRMPVTSFRGAVGHPGAAGGALGVAEAVLSLQEGRLAPTPGFREPDPEVPLNVTGEGPVEINGEAILVTSHAFGGQNASLVVRRYS